jgi:thiamine biosynthesis lipoprotein
MRDPRLIVCCIVAAALVAVNALDPPRARSGEPLKRFEFSEQHMGTTFRIVFYAPDEAVANEAARQAFARVEELNRIMSDYLDDSELMRLCKKPNQWVRVSDELFEVLGRAQKLSVATDGAFDITVGPVVRLWRRARRTLELPAPDALQKALALVGYRNVELDPATNSVRLNLNGMMLDLGGIAKGYAAQAVQRVLSGFGFSQALVAAGGDIVVSDAPPGAKGWKIELEAPLKDQSARTILLLTNAAVSTSGDASQFVTIGGKRYSHIVDPKTGMGIVGRRAVTVVAEGAFADGYASALCVMGIEKGMKLIEADPKRAARFVEAGDKETIAASTRFARHIASESKAK